MHNDCEENRNKIFQLQIQTFTDAFMLWSHSNANPLAQKVSDIELPEGSTEYPIQVIGVFSMSHLCLSLYPNLLTLPLTTEIKTLSIMPADKYPCTAFVQQGVILSAPSTPNVGFTVQCLELFRVLHLRCPGFHSRHI